MAWFRKEKKPLEAVDKTAIPEGLWLKCDNCKEIVYRKEVEQNFSVCPKCGYHFRITARERFEMLFDDGKYKEFAGDIRSADPLEFRDTKRYRDRLKVYEQRAGKGDAVLCAEGKLDGVPVVICAMEYSFMGGSMGSVVGEKITLAAERALDKKEPLLIISCSGGARMQEGILSLMQMAKISAALARLADAGLPYISILTDPTYGGTPASLAMMGDVNIAEPGAAIGFTGPRIIKQATYAELPPGFQSAEFQLRCGQVDLVVPRTELRERLAHLLTLYGRSL